MKASKRGNKEIIECLIQRGVNIFHNKNGLKALILASKENYDTIMQILLTELLDLREGTMYTSQHIERIRSLAHNQSNS